MKIRVAFVCWGNICRSTLSESVFTYKVKEKGLSDQFVIDSFATSTEEIGNPPHRGTVTTINLAPRLIPLSTRLFFLIRTLCKLFLLCIYRTSSVYLYIHKQ